MADNVNDLLSQYDDEARANYAAANQQPTRLRPEESYRGAFLPYRTTTDNKIEWAVPGIARDVWDAATEVAKAPVVGPGVPMSQMTEPQREQFTGHLMTGAMTPATGNLARMAFVPGAGKNELGIFGGRGAKTADLGALERAQRMTAEGVDRDQIWKDTGWGKFPDNQWRFEISDHAAKTNSYPNTPREAYINMRDKAMLDDNPLSASIRDMVAPYATRDTKSLLDEWKTKGSEIVAAANAGDMKEVYRLQNERAPLDAMIGLMAHRENGPLGAFLSHQALYDAYPEAANVLTRVAPDELAEFGARGSYHQRQGGHPEQFHLAQLKDYLPATKSVALHEIQHKLQKDEDFARGTNTVAAAGDIAEARHMAAELFSTTRQMQNAHYDEARSILGKAANGDAESQAFVDRATRRWEESFGRQSSENPYGVTPEMAVTYELTDTDPIFARINRRANEADRIGKQSPDERYRAHAGEVEARTVQKRMKMLPRHRQDRPPWYDFDVPEDKQVVRMGGDFGKPVVPHSSKLIDDSRARDILDQYTGTTK